MTERTKLVLMAEALAARVGHDVHLTLASGKELHCRIVAAGKGGDSLLIHLDGYDTVLRQEQVVMVRTVKTQAPALAA